MQHRLLSMLHFSWFSNSQSVFSLGFDLISLWEPAFWCVFLFWWPIREFAAPYEASDAEAARQCCEPSVCYANAISIPRAESTKKKSRTNVLLSFLVTRTGIEPMFPAWEASVLAAWPTGRISQLWYYIIFLFKLQYLFEKNFKKFYFFIAHRFSRSNIRSNIPLYII